MIHVFVGPTLAPEIVSELLPEAAVHPPIKHGDLLRLDPRPGDVLAIVDGLFHQEIAIRHKEILHLLERGVHVCGASSMGALRAAELHPFGMVGIGTIFEMLVSGEIEGDDEVSLVHGDASDGYPALSEALVDIRLHCRRALAAGVLEENDADTIVAAAAAFPYDERAYAQVLAAAVGRGLSPAKSAAYLTFVRWDGHSAKREDALALMRQLRDRAPAPASARVEVAETMWLHLWRHARSGWQDGSEQFVSDRAVLDFTRIAAHDYASFHERVTVEHLAALYGKHLDLEVPDARDLIADFRREIDAQSEDRWVAWRMEHQIGEEEVAASLDSKARLRAVTQASEEVGLEELRRLVGEYAVVLGLWPDGELPAAQAAQWLTTQEKRRLPHTEQVSRVAVRTFMVYPHVAVNEPFVAELKLSGAFARARATLIERPPLPEARPRAGDVVNWCARRWGVDAIGPLDILDRGLDNPTRYALGRSVTGALVKRARRFYARVEATGDFPVFSVASDATPARSAAGD